jgi:hypothetical protein
MSLMKNMRLQRMIPILFVFAAGCRSPLDLASTWTGSPVTIDGSGSEWTSLTALETPSLSLGARNDHQNVYLCFSTTDPELQTQILFAGFTVWFPGSHEGARPFGLQFPLKQDRPVRIEDRDQFESMFQAFEPRMNSLMILEGSERQQFPVMQTPGIKVRLGMTSGMLLYELQVPLRSAQGIPYAAVPGTDGTIAVTFETTEPDRDLQTGSTRPGGRSGRRMPGGGPAASIGGSETPRQFRLKTVIHLGQPGL